MRALLRLPLLAAIAICCANGRVLAEDRPAISPTSPTSPTSPIPPDDLVYCTVCHGVQLRGNPVIQAPRLSGMAEWYTRRQLEAFGKGWRGTHEADVYGMEMRPMAAALSDTQVADAARYVAAVFSEPAPATVEGDPGNGRALYASCAACHAADGSGVQALGAPRLTGVNDWYLLRQLQNFRDGVRGSHPDDTFGAQMRAAAGVLRDDEAIRDVVSYINGLQDRQGKKP